MEIKPILECKFFLDETAIRLRHQQGLYSTRVALMEYFVTRMRDGRVCYEKLRNISEKLGIKYETAKKTAGDLRKAGILYQDRCKSEVEINERKSYQRVWHWGDIKDSNDSVPRDEKVTKRNGNKTSPYDESEGNETYPPKVTKRTPTRLQNVPLKGNETSPHTREEDYIRNIDKNILSEEEAPQDSSSEDYLESCKEERATKECSYETETENENETENETHKAKPITFTEENHPIRTPPEISDWYYQCLKYEGHKPYDNRTDDISFSRYLLKFMKLSKMDEQQIKEYALKYVCMIPKRAGSHLNISEFTIFAKNEEAKRTGNCWVGQRKCSLAEITNDEAEKNKYDLDDCKENCQVKLPERYDVLPRE